MTVGEFRRFVKQTGYVTVGRGWRPKREGTSGRRRPPPAPRTVCLVVRSAWWAISQTKQASSRATADLMLLEIAGQVRSTAADLVRAAQAGEPDDDGMAEASTDEMLAEPPGVATGGLARGAGPRLGLTGRHEAAGTGIVGPVSGAVPVGGSSAPMSSRNGG